MNLNYIYLCSLDHDLPVLSQVQSIVLGNNVACPPSDAPGPVSRQCLHCLNGILVPIVDWTNMFTSVEVCLRLVCCCYVTPRYFGHGCDGYGHDVRFYHTATDRHRHPRYLVVIPGTSLLVTTVVVIAEQLIKFLETVDVTLSYVCSRCLSCGYCAEYPRGLGSWTWQVFLDWDLETQVYPIIRWLVHHQRAKIVDMVHQGLKTVFTLPIKTETPYVILSKMRSISP